MLILVNDIAASEGGALSVLTDFYQYVKEYGKQHNWIFLLSDMYVEETEHIRVVVMQEVKKSRLKKIQFDCFSGAKFINSLHPDVIFNLQNIATAGVHAPQTVYLHQSLPFQKIRKFSFLKTQERKIAVVQYVVGYFIKRNMKYADRVIVQTQWMKRALSEAVKFESDKICVIPPFIKISNDFRTEDPILGSFFYPTSHGIYKNNNIIREAAVLLRTNGIKDFKILLTTEQEFEDENILFTGKLSREEVFKHYSNSVLIFPSYIETYGLPLLEAGLCQSVIFASDTEFAHEILDGYNNAYFFDPFNAKSLADLMIQVMEGKIKRRNATLVRTGVDNTWERVVHILTGKE